MARRPRPPLRDRLGRFVARRAPTPRKAPRVTPPRRPIARPSPPRPRPQRARRTPQRIRPSKRPRSTPVRRLKKRTPRPTKRTRSPHLQQRKPPTPRVRKRKTPVRRQSHVSPKRPTKRVRRPTKRSAPRQPRTRRPLVTASTEYAVSLSYAAKKHASNVSAQLALLGPPNAPREDIETAIAHKVKHGTNPDGWQIKFTEWRGRDVGPDEQSDFFSIFARFADDADVDDPTSREASVEEIRNWNSESESEE